jgi:endosialidase-like protein
MNRVMPAVFSVVLGLGCFCLSPLAPALNPPPDGGYPNANTAEGGGALDSLTTGGFNTATGWLALRANTTASANTAVGAEALRDSNGDANTAIGSGALFTNTIGGSNTAIGANALRLNTTGNYNVASGFRALASNTAGNYNMASGFMALNQNTINDFNTAIGAGALFFNTADENTAVGAAALLNNSTGDSNTAAGSGALFRNTNGAHNTADGYQALATNTTGNDNTALGFLAGSSQTTGNDNIYIGSGTLGLPGESNACYIASIFGQTIANGAVVLVNQSNKLGTLTSSVRFKRDIHDMDKASEALFALRPVAFRYKEEIDPAGRSQLGLVAEDVEKVNPDLVVRDKEGMPYTVRYDQVNAMLLNEFLKEHRKVEELEANAAKQQKQIAALTAGLQKVAAELEPNRSAQQTVLNNR